MSNFHINLYSGAANQKGAALIISLMMLVVMTILGVSAITTTTMEEKMAGNIRNKHISFQSAESAMRAAEVVVNTLSRDQVFNGSGGFYSATVYGDANFPIWEFDNPPINWQTITTDTGAVQSPEWIIEDFGTSYRDEDCALIVPLPSGCELPVYRVTARGWGLNTNGFTLLQSTYKQL